MPTRLADAQALSALTNGTVPAATIRWWASQGWLTRKGQDDRRRTLYDIDEFTQVAERRGRLTTTAA